jgi:hypothetical protein
MAGPKKANNNDVPKGTTLAETQAAVSRANADPMATSPDREATPGGQASPGNTTNTTKRLSILPSPTNAPELHYTHSRQRLTEAKLNAMSKAEIRAVALDRGYEMAGLGGKGGVIRSFLSCQKDEEGLHNPGDEVDNQGNEIPNLPQTEEYPSIDSSRSDEDLRAQFESEAKAKGYNDDDSVRIADGRLADLRAGGDGYTVRGAPQTPAVPESSTPTPPEIQ